MLIYVLLGKPERFEWVKVNYQFLSKESAKPFKKTYEKMGRKCVILPPEAKPPTKWVD